MTVIAYKDGVMAADSCSFSGGIRYRAMHRKISRGRGLIGAAGRASDAVLVHQWFIDGMPDTKPPFSGDKDDWLQILWAKPDGTLWHGDERLVFSEIDPLEVIGESSASTFTHGAMCAGMSADDAVRLAIKHCIYVGGEVQVEYL